VAIGVTGAGARWLFLPLFQRSTDRFQNHLLVAAYGQFQIRGAGYTLLHLAVSWLLIGLKLAGSHFPVKAYAASAAGVNHCQWSHQAKEQFVLLTYRRLFRFAG